LVNIILIGEEVEMGGMKHAIFLESRRGRHVVIDGLVSQAMRHKDACIMDCSMCNCISEPGCCCVPEFLAIFPMDDFTTMHLFLAE
jgi:hypothetical protein